jgi:hypothetical protein
MLNLPPLTEIPPSLKHIEGKIHEINEEKATSRNALVKLWHKKRNRRSLVWKRHVLSMRRSPD